MSEKLTYAELEQRTKELEKEAILRKQTEEMLRESEEKFSKTFHTAPIMIAINKLKDGKYLEINDSFTKLLGYCREDIIGRTVLELGVVSTDSLEKVNHFIRNNMFYNQEMDLHTKDGTVRTAMVSVQVIQFGDEKCSITVAEDITRQKQAEYVINIQLDLGIALSKTSDIDEALVLVVDSGISFEGLDSCGIYLRNPANEGFDLVSVKGFSPEFTEIIRRYDKDTQNFQMIMKGASFYAGDVTTGLPLDNVRRREGIKAIGIIPMIHMGKVIGCLNAGSHTVDEIPEASKNALETVASQISGSIARVMAEEEIRKQNRELQALSEELQKEIYDRKQINTALRKSEEKFRGLVESSSDWIWEVNTQGVYTYASPQVEDMLGYKQEDVIGKTLFDMMPQEEALKSRKIFRDKIRKGEGFVLFENINLHKDGRYVVLETSGVPVLDEAEKVVGYKGVDRDITERKQAEKALRESKHNLSEVQRITHMGSWVWNMETDELVCSDEMLRLWGYPPDKHTMTGQKALELIHPEDRDRVLRGMERSIKNKVRYETEHRIILPDGNKRIILAIEDSEHRKEGRWPIIRCSVQDITERKRTEGALLEIEEKWKSLVNNTKDLIQILDTEGTILYMNKVYSPHEMKDVIGKSVLEFTEEEFKDVTQKSIDRLKAGEDPKAFETAIRISESDIVQLEVKYIPMFEDGKVNKVISLVSDITEKKIAEKKLRKSEEKYRLLAENVTDNIWTMDMEMNLTYCSPSVTHMRGYSVEEAMAQSLEEIMTPASFDVAVKIIAEDLELHKKGQIDPKRSRKMEAELFCKDGSTVWTEIESSFLFDPELQPIGILGVTRNITERKQAEEDRNRLQAQLQQSHKMEAIGTLAGGIAHDFNNILSGIFGYTQLLQMQMGEDSETAEYLDSILKAGNRAKDLVQQILTFSRQTVHELNPLRVEHVITEALKLIRSSLPSTISIHRKIQNDCGLVFADHTQIHQIVLNLCTNGYQAMEEAGGKLTVTLKEVDLAAEDIKDPVMNPGAYVCLSVADTGTGIDQCVIDRIFDPYFTTKEKGKGTGLGLAVIHGIVKSHGGHITVDSEPGKGTEVLVYLPVIKDEPEAAESVFSMATQKGNEHVLLVDDQKEVIDIEQQMLEALEYQVTTRTSSLDALEAFRANPDDFDLVITDMTMPEMTGDKLARELIKIRADIPVILCTGFSETMSKEKAATFGIKEFLMKPLIVEELSSTIRNILNGQ